MDNRTVLGIALLLPLLGLAFALPAAAENCPERPACHGCGCKGGPGYRGPNGQCVGFKNLDKVCGVPPATHCTFENAPGTGANAECATHPKRAPKPSLPPAAQDDGAQ